jgi:hypothetical protein
MEPKAHPEWKELLNKFKDCEYGTFIPHSTIEFIIGQKRGSKYYAIVNRWKKAMLEEASRQVEVEQTRGYEVVMPNRFRNSATKQIKFGYKRMNKAGKIIKNVPVNLLADGEKQKVGETAALLAQILHFGKSTLKKVKEIDKKTDKLLLDVGKALDIGD